MIPGTSCFARSCRRNRIILVDSNINVGISSLRPQKQDGPGVKFAVPGVFHVLNDFQFGSSLRNLTPSCASCPGRLAIYILIGSMRPTISDLSRLRLKICGLSHHGLCNISVLRKLYLFGRLFPHLGRNFVLKHRDMKENTPVECRQHHRMSNHVNMSTTFRS